MKFSVTNILAIIISIILFSPAFAGDTKASLETLKKNLNSMGAPKLEGKDLYFGSTKINGNYKAVDAVKKAHGGVATVFAKEGAEYIRVSTNVLKDDGMRAVGTTLAHNAAFDSVNKGTTYCGEADILGGKYDTCYEPIKSNNAVIGLYFVGFEKK